jgi:NTE family protein
MGAMVEIGALAALEEALPGLPINGLDGYVGVSAGALVAAALANGMTPRQLSAAFIEGDGPKADRIRPSLFFQPALAEYARRGWTLPILLAQAGWTYAFDRRSLIAALERLGRALPTGLFTNAPLEERVRKVFSAPARSNDFRKLTRRLVVVATDLDRGTVAPFGQAGWDEVPISQAVAASAALPGLFPPVPIRGPEGERWYVDGALKKTLHARVLLDMGLDLVICLNPLVPFDASRAPNGAAPGAGDDGDRAHHAHRVMGGASGRIPSLVTAGLPVVLSQTFRTMIHSRLELGMKGYKASHPGADIVLLEPDQRDPELFLANLFGYSQRRALAEHAYQSTRAYLRSHRGSLRPVLARHGLALDDAALDDPGRRLLRNPPAAMPLTQMALTLKRLDEVLLDLKQQLPLSSRAELGPR